MSAQVVKILTLKRVKNIPSLEDLKSKYILILS
jgi:hypothetical protein